MENPKPTFTYLVSEIVKRHPSLAYLHVVEPRAHDNMESDSTEGPTSQPNHVSDLNATPDEEVSTSCIYLCLSEFTQQSSRTISSGKFGVLVHSLAQEHIIIARKHCKLPRTRAT